MLLVARKLLSGGRSSRSSNGKQNRTDPEATVIASWASCASGPFLLERPGPLQAWTVEMPSLWFADRDSSKGAFYETSIKTFRDKEASFWVGWLSTIPRNHPDTLMSPLARLIYRSDFSLRRGVPIKPLLCRLLSSSAPSHSLRGGVDVPLLLGNQLGVGCKAEQGFFTAEAKE